MIQTFHWYPVSYQRKFQYSIKVLSYWIKKGFIVLLFIVIFIIETIKSVADIFLEKPQLRLESQLDDFPEHLVNYYHQLLHTYHNWVRDDCVFCFQINLVVNMACIHLSKQISLIMNVYKVLFHCIIKLSICYM